MSYYQTTYGTFELFCVDPMEAMYNCANLDHADENTLTAPGWYYWPCLPGCLPDGGAMGPYDSDQQALEELVKYESDGMTIASLEPF